MNKNIPNRLFVLFLMMGIVLGQTGVIEAASFAQSGERAYGNAGDAGKDDAGTDKATEKFSAHKNDAVEMEYVPGEVIVRYRADRINLRKASGRSRAEALAEDMRLEKKEDIKGSNSSLLKIADGTTVEDKIAELKQDPSVEYAQPNFQYQPLAIDTDDTYKNLLWGLDNTGQSANGTLGTADADIDAPEAWTIDEGDAASVIVAVIDTGADYEHPDLAANMWDGSACKDWNGNYLGACEYGYDFEYDDKAPMPTSDSHGTHVAGTIAASKGNGKGVIGVAPHAKIMALKSSLTTAEIVKAINFAEYNGAKIINASWGGDASSCNEAFDSETYNAIRDFDGLFVTAAGNGNKDHDGTTYFEHPSDYGATTGCWTGLDNIISVAATDQNDALASFSDYGADFVDVAAPGVNIYSTASDKVMLDETFSEVATPAIPADWTKGNASANNWGTLDLGGSYGNVIYGDLANPYADNANTTLTSPAYDFSDTDSAEISFIGRCDTEYDDINTAKDYMAIEYSGDNGSTFTEINRWNEPYLDNLFEDSDPAGSVGMTYTDDEISAQYLRNGFRLRFRWVTNSSVGGAGCFVDNIMIRKVSAGAGEVYKYLSGTSMATPHVTGLAALVWGYKPALTLSQVKNIILNTGDALPALSGKTMTGKRINAQKAMAWLTPTATVSYDITDMTKTDVIATLTPDESGMEITSAGGLTHTFTANGSFTFTFTDTDGNTGSTTATVNNIDKVAPVIALTGNDAINVLVGGAYTELGATATDNHDAEFAAAASGTVDATTIGLYTITYSATDAAGNAAASVTRTVNVVGALDSAETDITSFRLAGTAGVIDEENHTISATVPFGTDVTDLAPVVMLSAGASVSPASGTANDFTSAQGYTVTAENSVATQAYAVTVTVDPDPDISLLAADKDALTASSILGTNSSAANITAALMNPLPANGSVNGSAIAWASSSPDVISDNGQTVNRPLYSAGDSNVTMTATLTKGAITGTKDFALTVTKLPASTIASVASTTYTVSASTISGVPYNTAKATFLAAIAKGESHQSWNESGLSGTIVSGNTLTITAEDAITSVTYMISVNSAPSGGGGGGGNTTPVSVSASDEPLQLRSSQQGTLTHALSGSNSLRLEIPKGSVASTTTFTAKQGSLAGSDAPNDGAWAFLFAGLVFDIDAVDPNGETVTSFTKELTITLTVSELPADKSDLKIYYFSEIDDKWMPIEDVTFTANTIGFKTAHLTRFAVFSAKQTTEETVSDIADTGIIGASSVSDGDIIQCKNSANPFAVYIVKTVNGKNYLRHIINLNIFNHYKHLRWENLKQVDSLSAYSMSGWVRVNTGTNGRAGASDKVWEINGDQTRHWINMTAEQFLLHGGSDEAVYAINREELDLYATGADVMSL